jgi:hypothetical protein
MLLPAFLILSGGCKVNRGTPVIKKEKMVEILADIHLAQAVLDQEVPPQGAKREYYYCNILERHGVTEAVFDSAIAWYATNMDIFEQVYAEVIARLELEKTELEQPQK